MRTRSCPLGAEPLRLLCTPPAAHDPQAVSGFGACVARCRVSSLQLGQAAGGGLCLGIKAAEKKERPERPFVIPATGGWDSSESFVLWNWDSVGILASCASGSAAPALSRQLLDAHRDALRLLPANHCQELRSSIFPRRETGTLRPFLACRRGAPWSPRPAAFVPWAACGASLPCQVGPAMIGEHGVPAWLSCVLVVVPEDLRRGGCSPYPRSPLAPMLPCAVVFTS